jgi:uncharacterized membrane protein
LRYSDVVPRKTSLAWRTWVQKWAPGLLVAAAVISSALMYPALPEQVPVHWGATGEPDRWVARSWGALLLPLIMLLNWMLLSPLLRKERTVEHGNATQMGGVVLWGSMLVLFALHLGVLYTAMRNALSGATCPASQVVPRLSGQSGEPMAVRKHI